MSSDLIGVRHDSRHACTEGEHLPNCYNPGLDLTACVCGAVWWRGQVGTWHSRALKHVNETGRRPTYTIVGWDRYFLHAPGCRNRRREPSVSHVCGRAVGATFAQAAVRP